VLHASNLKTAREAEITVSREARVAGSSPTKYNPFSVEMDEWRERARGSGTIGIVCLAPLLILVMACTGQLNINPLVGATLAALLKTVWQTVERGKVIHCNQIIVNPTANSHDGSNDVSNDGIIDTRMLEPLRKLAMGASSASSTILVPLE
jgi:hypothetical protein